MTRTHWAILAAGAAGLLAGCADLALPADIGAPFNVSLIGYLQLRATTRVEAEQWFGPPTARVTLSNEIGDTTGNFRNAYLHASTDAYGSVTEFLEVEFDPAGLVAGIRFLESDNEPPDM